MNVLAIAEAKTAREAEECAAGVLVELLAGWGLDVDATTDAVSLRRFGYLVDVAACVTVSEEIGRNLSALRDVLRIRVQRLGDLGAGAAVIGAPRDPNRCHDAIARAWGLSGGVDLGRLRAEGLVQI